MDSGCHVLTIMGLHCRAASFGMELFPARVFMDTSILGASSATIDDDCSSAERATATLAKCLMDPRHGERSPGGLCVIDVMKSCVDVDVASRRFQRTH